MIAFAVFAFLPGLLLAIGLFRWLRRAGFGGSEAAELTMLGLAQAGPAMAFSLEGSTLWLALGVAAVASSAAAFAEHEDLRRVILFGGSLAAIQLCDPSGAIVAAGMLPATFALAAPRTFPKAAGFHVSVLFLPLCMGALLLGLAWDGHVLVFPGARAHVTYSAPLIRALLVVAPGIVVAPALYLARVTKAGRAVGLVAGTVVFAEGLAALDGAIRPPETMLSVSAPLTVLAIAALPRSSRRMPQAIGAALAGVALSWAALALGSA